MTTGLRYIRNAAVRATIVIAFGVCFLWAIGLRTQHDWRIVLLSLVPTAVVSSFIFERWRPAGRE